MDENETCRHVVDARPAPALLCPLWHERPGMPVFFRPHTQFSRGGGTAFKGGTPRPARISSHSVFFWRRRNILEKRLPV